MRSIDFPQANLPLAKDQPEYETLHVHVETKQVEIPPRIAEQGEVIPGKIEDISWSMTACFELSDEEIEEIVRTRKLWYTQMVFGKQFQPIRMRTQNPFIT